MRPSGDIWAVSMQNSRWSGVGYVSNLIIRLRATNTHELGDSLPIQIRVQISIRTRRPAPVYFSASVCLKYARRTLCTWRSFTRALFAGCNLSWCRALVPTHIHTQSARAKLIIWSGAVKSERLETKLHHSEHSSYCHHRSSLFCFTWLECWFKIKTAMLSKLGGRRRCTLHTAGALDAGVGGCASCVPWCRAAETQNFFNYRSTLFLHANSDWCRIAATFMRLGKRSIWE